MKITSDDVMAFLGGAILIHLHPPMYYIERARDAFRRWRYDSKRKQ